MGLGFRNSMRHRTQPDGRALCLAMPHNVRVIGNPDYWRKRAEEARTRSERVGDSITKALIWETADAYERMAKACEEQPSTFPHED